MTRTFCKRMYVCSVPETLTPHVFEIACAFCYRNSIVTMFLKWLIHSHLSRTLHHLCDVKRMSHVTYMLTMSLKGLVHSVKETLSLRCLWNDSFIPHISRTLCHLCDVRRLSHVTYSIRFIFTMFLKWPMHSVRETLTMSLKGLVHSVRETLSRRCLWNDSFICTYRVYSVMWCETNESCDTWVAECTRSMETHMELMSHTYWCFILRMNESCHTYEYVIWMSHITHR